MNEKKFNHIKLYGIDENGKRKVMDSTTYEGLVITLEELIDRWKEEIEKGWYLFEKFVVVDHTGKEHFI